MVSLQQNLFFKEHDEVRWCTDRISCKSNRFFSFAILSYEDRTLQADALKPMFKMQSRRSALMLFFVIIWLWMKCICPKQNMLIQSVWAPRRSPPNHNRHRFIISQFIFALFIDPNFSLLLSIMMPKVNEANRCTCGVALQQYWQNSLTWTDDFLDTAVYLQ